MPRASKGCGTMFAQEIRRQAEEAPREALPAVAKAMWSAFAAEQITEAEAEALSALIEARTALPLDHRTTGQPADTLPARVGAPRTAAAQLGPLRSIFPARRPQRAPDRSVAIERRRRLAASGPMPPALAARFTTSELAVLRIVADEAMRHGACRLYLDAIAARAGVSRSTVKNTLRQARLLGLLLVQERPQRGAKSLSNIVSLADKGWLAWLRRGPGIGGRKIAPADTQVSNPGKTRTARGPKGHPATPNSLRRVAARAAGA